MKPLLLWTLALLGAAGAARAQALRGDYVSTNGGFVTDFFRFQSDTFTYTQSGCTGLTKGAGIFSVRHDTLYLHFQQLTEPAQQITTCPMHEAGRLTVRVVDGTGQPILGAYAYIRPTRADNKTIGAAADPATGEAVFAYTPMASDSLAIACIGYETRYIPVSSVGSNCVQVALGFTSYIPAGTIYRYTLQNLGHSFDATYLPEDAAAHPRPLHYKHIAARRTNARLKLLEQVHH